MSLQRRTPLKSGTGLGKPQSKAAQERAAFEPEWLAELMQKAETYGRFTDWEEEFIGGIRDRFLQYAENLFLTEKQLEHLRKIEKKIDEY